ncbi:hypothetical protein HPB50_027693 [Hyalomma asiaticum]|nr:hypothetical protein HPB50_027693 [Hyalomma asiaticum]
MTDREPEVRHSTLNDEYESEDPHGDTQRRRFSPETPTTTRIESSTELTILATTMQMMAQLLERQMGAPENSVNGANENATIQITTMPDLTATLPTFSGTDNDSLNEWVTSVENMRERCSWNDMATLNAGISRLRGQAAAWHRMDGSQTCDKTATDYDEPDEQFQLQSDTRHKLQLNEDEQMPPRTADDQPRRKKPPRWLEDYVTDISDYCEDATDEKSRPC